MFFSVFCDSLVCVARGICHTVAGTGLRRPAEGEQAAGVVVVRRDGAGRRDHARPGGAEARGHQRVPHLRRQRDGEGLAAAREVGAARGEPTGPGRHRDDRRGGLRAPRDGPAPCAEGSGVHGGAYGEPPSRRRYAWSRHASQEGREGDAEERGRVAEILLGHRRAGRAGHDERRAARGGARRLALPQPRDGRVRMAGRARGEVAHLSRGLRAEGVRLDGVLHRPHEQGSVRRALGARDDAASRGAHAGRASRAPSGPRSRA